jgi:hypothetical protein
VIRRLALVAYPVLSLLGALVIFVSTRHHPIGHQRFLTVVVPAAFVLGSIVIAIALWRWRLSPSSLIATLDLFAWIPMAGVVEVARRGAGSVLFWFGLALCARAVAWLVVIGRAVVERRLDDRTCAISIAVIAILFYIAPLPLVRLDRGLQLKGDEPHYMVTTISLLRDRDLFVEDEYAAHVYTPFYDQTLAPHAVPARGGHLAPFHDAGLPLVATIPYALGGWIGVVLAMALLAGLTVREMFLLVRTAGTDQRAAFTATALIGFTLPLAVYATQIYPEIPGALLTVAIVRRLMPARFDVLSSVVVGIMLGALPWFQVRFWAIVAPLLLAALLTRRAWNHRIAVAVPVLAATLAYVALNYAVYARLTISPFLFHESVGPHLGALVVAAGGPAAVVLDVVRPWLDPYDGPLWLSPAFILAAIGVPLALRHGTAVTRLAMIAVAGYGLLVGVHYLISTSGDSPPGRFLVAVLPLLVLPLGEMLAPSRRWWSMPLALGLGAVGAVMVVISIAQPLLARYPYGGAGGPVAILGQRLHLPVVSILPSFGAPTAGTLLKALAAIAIIAMMAVLAMVSPTRKSSGLPSTRPYNGTNADVSG